VLDGSSESQLGIAFVNFMRYAFPHVLAWHTRNENATNEIQGKILKDIGVLAGVHDYCLIWPYRNFATLELKRAAVKAKYSPKQQEFADRMDMVGFPHAVANSPATIIAALKSFGLVSMYKFPTLSSSEQNMRMQYIHLVRRGLNPPTPRGYEEFENPFAEAVGLIPNPN